MEFTMMLFPKQIKIVEVGPRDGLQNETRMISTEIKVELINRLSETGLSVIEATSFVSPKWIPQLADHREVFLNINKKNNIHYPVLIPNLQGLETALSVGIKEIAVFTTPSEQFSQKNTHCSVEESLERIAEILVVVKQKELFVRAYLSCVLGCPFSGEISSGKVVELAGKLYRMGCKEISLGDTIGVGTPLKTKQLIQAVKKVIPVEKIAVHFHDTYGQALANILIALEEGVTIIDSAVAGLGGCPYAKGTTGNVATEDVLYMLHGMGINTGVDLKKLISVSQFISQQLGREPQSKVAKAMLSQK